MKTCSKCKEEKELSEFYKNGNYLRPKCKLCSKEYIKKYNKSDACKEAQKKYNKSDAFLKSRKKYNLSDAFKNSKKKYKQTDTYKETQKKYLKEYMNTEMYFKTLLNKKGFKENDISPELIELQKLSIVTYRYTQQLNQVKQ